MNLLPHPAAFRWFLVALLFLIATQPVQAAFVCSTATPISGSFSGVVNDYWSGSGSPAAGATSIALGSSRSRGSGNSWDSNLAVVDIGGGASLGYSPMDSLWIVVGYNFTGADTRTQGPFISVHMKVDQDTLGLNNQEGGLFGNTRQ